ncbi:peptidase S8, subtilisin-related protein [Artemisia annua]|uniref:Peptidase S8, subtilisin-related protein n=1 Tax=Artemisia annua TaxID=35608 RepID=A0A2U1MBN7_ARTAN|nr:peptidase S8, subtilisin-related protein [Artemisia annua]
MGFLGLRKIISNEFISRITYVHANVYYGIRFTPPPPKGVYTEHKVYKLLTTHSQRWLGFRRGLIPGMWVDKEYGRGIIIAIIDTGITPTHPSFHDQNIPPPSKKWKGGAFNNKILLLKKYYEEDLAIVDLHGHGTHVASIAGGNFVHDANVFKQVSGTASGTAPYASLTIYQTTLWDKFDELHPKYIEAITDAADDGADLINLSVAWDSNIGLQENTIELGAFYATSKGILVCCAAGNDGPRSSTLCNAAPWILTVGAGNMDRVVRATITLGNTKIVFGECLNQPDTFPNLSFPVVYGNEARVDHNYFKGKIVFFDRGLFSSHEAATKRYKMIKSRVVAFIEPNSDLTGYSMFDTYRDITTARVNYKDGLLIRDYIDSASCPTATLTFYGTIYGVDTPPDVASFSGRGPSKIHKGIIKPDVIAPGVEILGANFEYKKNAQLFRVSSGTSYACPHVTGLAALIKKSHPTWSPAMIKSAIMTTAYSVKRNGEPIKDEQMVKASLYSIGSGHINPVKAIDPGIVFDVRIHDYIAYLLGLGYKKKDLCIMLKREVNDAKGIEGPELNLPSFCLQLRPGETKTYERTGENVGKPNSAYVVKVISETKGVKVDVVPQQLKFSKLNQKIKFQVSFKLDNGINWKSTNVVEGSIALVSSSHTVTMPFLIEVIRGKMKTWNKK